MTTTHHDPIEAIANCAPVLDEDVKQLAEALDIDSLDSKLMLFSLRHLVMADNDAIKGMLLAQQQTIVVMNRNLNALADQVKEHRAYTEEEWAIGAEEETVEESPIGHIYSTPSLFSTGFRHLAMLTASISLFLFAGAALTANTDARNTFANTGVAIGVMAPASFFLSKLFR